MMLVELPDVEIQNIPTKEDLPVRVEALGRRVGNGSDRLQEFSIAKNRLLRSNGRVNRFFYQFHGFASWVER